MSLDPITLRGTTPGPQLFASALHAAYALDWPIIDPDFAQHSDVAIWEKIHRDGKILQAINQRTATIASKSWIIEPRGDDEKEIQLAGIVESLLQNVSKFHMARRFLAQAIFRGRAYLFVEGDRRRVSIGKMPAQDWWFPQRLRHLDKRVVQLVPQHRRENGREMVTVRREIFSPSTGEWKKLNHQTARLLIEIVYDDEQGRLGYGRGLLEALYFLWWAKSVVLKEGLQAVERWAQGFLVAQVDSEKMGSTSADTETIRNKMRDELEAHRSRHVAVVDKSDTIQVVTGGGEGWQLVMGMLNYLDNCILSTSMGAVLPFGGGLDKGSMARAEVEEDVSDELLEYDRGVVDETITDGLIPLIIDNNRAILSKMGLRDVRMPDFKTNREKKEDHEKNANVIAVALGAGVSLKKEEVYEKLGFSMPAEGDEVFEGGGDALPLDGLNVPDFGGSPRIRSNGDRPQIGAVR